MEYTQLIFEMYKNGIGIDKISKVFNVSTVEIFKSLRSKGILRKIEAFTVERDDKACLMYENNSKIIEIANLLKLDRHTVVDILKRRGVYKSNKKTEAIDIPEKKERNEAIILLYSSGLSLSQVSKQIGVCPGTVRNVLDYYGIKKRAQHQNGHSKGTSKNRKHYFNLEYFKKIDTEEKAYWLGFIYADGCIHDRGLVTLSLQEQDKEHLLKLKKCIGADTLELSYSKKTKAYRLDISSVGMTNDLIHLGCTPNKTLTLSFPTLNQVPLHLIHHFMRGYFDGDGCIYISEKNKNIQIFSVLGTHDFLDKYEEYLLDGMRKKMPTKRQHREHWNESTEQITYGGKQQAIKIFHFLYKDATIYLQRKYDKFNILLPS